MNIVDGLEMAARHRAQHPAIRFEERVITYGELREATMRLAAGLAEAGVCPGERVCLLLPNTPIFPIAYYAVLRLGAIAVSVNVMSKSDEIEHIVNDCAAAAVITLRENLDHLPPRSATPALRHVFADADADIGADHIINFNDILERADTPPFPVFDIAHRDMPAALLYTSGTTGRSKGAILSHGNVISNVHTTRHLVGMRPDDRMICFLPLFHCFGQNFILNATLYSGATLVLQRRFVPDDVLAAVERHGVTHFFGVPTVYIALLAHPRAAAVFAGPATTVRYDFSAAAILPTEIERRWHALTGRHVHEGYGLTETSPFASYNHAFAWRAGSVGAPIDNVEMRVVDEDDRPLSDNEVGELCIRGPNVMLGYWGRPEDTARAIVDGWFHSGDIGYRDNEGNYYIVDRVKDMINAGGFKIWPREVEEVLFGHPAVRESAVVGVPDDYLGEAVKAFVVLREGASATVEELIVHCRVHLSDYKVPRQVEFTASIPKGATGKMLKKDLRGR